MAEFLKEESESELFFNSLENEISHLFEKLNTLLNEKRKNILEMLNIIRQNYKKKEESRKKKLSELNEFKCMLSNTNMEFNEIMEIRGDTLQNIEEKISQLIVPSEFPNVMFHSEQFDSILATIDTIQLLTSDNENEFDVDTSFENAMRQKLAKLSLEPELVSSRHKSLVRHMTLQKRESTIQARPITDIKIVSNKSQIPVGYIALDSTAGGKEVQLWEELWLKLFTVKPKRYLCYTRQTMDTLSITEGTTKRSRLEIPESDQIVVTDIRLLSSSTYEFIPLDYEVVERTVDQNEVSLNKHILLVKYEKKLETETAVSQIMFLEQSQVTCLPSKFSSVNLPINGYYICFHSDIFESSSESSSVS